MGDIYRQARRTLVWFGYAAFQDGIPLVFAFLSDLLPSKNNSLSDQSITFLIREIFLERDISKIERFLRRPWFQRRWVIQEVALGHDTIIHCGPYKMSWHWFVNGLNKLQAAAHRNGLSFEFSALDAVRNATLIHSHSSELLTLLWDFHTCKCSDPRDRIFALFGLAEDVVSMNDYGQAPEFPRIDVDYESSWVEIYRRLALHCVSARKWHVFLDHLFAFGSLREELKDPSIPSWIPAWNQARRSSGFRSKISITGFSIPFCERGFRELEFNGGGEIYK